MQKNILIADTDSSTFTNNLQGNYSNCNFIKAHNLRDAKQIIENKHSGVGAILINPILSKNAAIDVIYTAIKHRPTVPIFYLQDKDSKFPLTESEWTALGVKGILQKPLNVDEMIERVSPISLSEDTIEKMDYFSDVDEKIILNDQDQYYTKISCIDLLTNTKQNFDIFIRLSSGKYIKLLNRHDSFTKEQIEGYLSKGVQKLYILKTQHEELLKICNEITSKILKEKRISLERKTGFLLQQGETVVQYLQTIKLTPENIEYAKQFTNNVELYMRQFTWFKTDDVESFIDQVRVFEHSVSTTMLSGLLMKHLPQYFDIKKIHTYGLAAMFHDIGLFKTLPEHCWKEDLTLMSQEEVRIFMLHPIRSVEALSTMQGFDQELLNAVAQHHMRTNGGFPFQNANIQKSMLAEVIGICDEFSKLISRSDENPWFNIKTELEKKVYPGFSRPVVEAFISTFFPNA